MHAIGLLFDRQHFSIHRIIAETGSIRPTQRTRASSALTLADREEVARAIAANESSGSVAARLERAPSTISREIKRNGGQDAYRANHANQAAWDRANRPKRCKLADNCALATHRLRQAAPVLVGAAPFPAKRHRLDTIHIDW